MVGLGALGVVTRSHPGRRAGLRGAAARLRGARVGHAARALRRDRRERLQRERVKRAGARRWIRCGSEAASPTSRRPCGATSSALARRRFDRHPILGIDPVNCTPQLGRAGAWSDWLPYFRMGFTPSSGEELQSEYLVRARARRGRHRGGARPGGPPPPARPGVRAPDDRRRPAVDEPAVPTRHGRHPLHLDVRAGRRRPARSPHLERALAPFDARPHWGKLFASDATTLAARYERLPDFARLVERLDPARRVQERVAEARVLGARL